MKKLLHNLIIAALLSFPAISFGQVINLGTAANFALFTSIGAVTNTGISHLTGNVGTNNGSSTDFGNVNGQMHDNDGASAQAVSDVLGAYNQIQATVSTFFPAPALGNGQILLPGIYAVTGASTLNGILSLNAQGNANAVFIIKIQGSLSTAANSSVKLLNGAKACNVFWTVEGLVSMAIGTNMKGTVIANNAAIEMNTNDTLEGRALSTNGAITITNIMVKTPIGCGSPVLTGPIAPNLASTECYALFSANGGVTNAGTTTIVGDVGTNVGLTTGFNPLNVTGNIHPIPDGSTAACAADLINVHSYLINLPFDIELLFPAQFGNNLVLTPHTYQMNGAVTFTDTLFLNAEGNANAIFVIQVVGAFSTSTHVKVVLTNGTQAKNVFWDIDGAVDISDSSDFIGTIICNNGAIDIANGTTLNGRALTTDGALNIAVSTVTAPTTPTSCGTVGITTNTANSNNVVTIYPNPFKTTTTIIISNTSEINVAEVSITNLLGEEVKNIVVTKQAITINTSEFPKGVYFYSVIANNKILQTGKLISL